YNSSCDRTVCKALFSSLQLTVLSSHYLPSNCLIRSSVLSSLQVCLLNKNTIPHLAFSIFNLVIRHLYALCDVYIHLHGEYSHNHIHISKRVFNVLCTTFCHAFSQFSKLFHKF